MRQALVVTTTLLLTSSALAADVQVTLSADATATECLSRARVRAGEHLGERVHTPSTFTVRASAGSEIRAEADGCWSETVAWDGEQTVALRLFPAATVEGAFETGKQASPTRVTGWLYLPGGSRAIQDTAPERLGNAAQCNIEKARWKCVVPAGTTFDLRLDVSGFASVHYRDLAVPPAQATELEPQTLRAGATVAGWVQTMREAAIRNARVTVFPLGQQRRGARTSSMRTARTNARGSFQIDGLEPGRYRLVSEAAGLSPVVIPEIDLRDGGTLTLPRAVRHDAFAEAVVTVDPARDAKERPWSVEIVEAVPLYPGRRAVSIVRSVTKDGIVEAKSLRTDVYDVVVRDAAGSVVRRAELDLFGGGRKSLHLSVQPVMLRGTVTAGGEAIYAKLTLAAGTEVVNVLTDDAGRFETALPQKGVWSVNVLYPPDDETALIEAPRVEVPQELEAGAPHEVSIALPGGRLRGEVVDRRGQAAASAVYLRRLSDGRLAAQQLTRDDGRFDLLGLKPGRYAVEAQTAEGGTARAVEVEVEERESAEVRIVTEPYARFSGYVVTPDGRPASGAVVRYSPDGGQSWTEVTADIRGYFEKPVNAAVQSIPMVVLTFDYPAAMLNAPSGERLQIQLRGDGGVIHFGREPRTSISARGVRTGALTFLHPRPYGRFNGGIWVESGTYSLCRADTCRTVTVTPGSEQTVVFEEQESSR